MGHGIGVMGFPGPLLMVLIWLGMIALAFWLVIKLFPSTTGNLSPKNISSQEILDQRYAKGEISQAEYKEMQETLNEKHIT